MGKNAASKNVGSGAAPKKGGTAVDVVGVDGFIRTYSKKEHGADFRALADEFASKAEGRKVVAHKGGSGEEEETEE